MNSQEQINQISNQEIMKIERLIEKINDGQITQQQICQDLIDTIRMINEIKNINNEQ